MGVLRYLHATILLHFIYICKISSTWSFLVLQNHRWPPLFVIIQTSGFSDVISKWVCLSKIYSRSHPIRKILASISYRFLNNISCTYHLIIKIPSTLDTIFYQSNTLERSISSHQKRKSKPQGINLISQMLNLLFNTFTYL